VIVPSAFEAPTLVACLDDIAVVGQPIEQCGGHLGVAEYARPFTEGQIGGDDDGGAFIEPADEVEEELTAGLSEWQIAEFVEDDEVHAGQMIGEPALPSIAALRLKPIDEVDHVMEPATGAGADAVSGDCDGKMGFAGSRRTSVIMPGARRLKFASSIRSTRGAAKLLLRLVASAMLVGTTWSSGSGTALSPCCPPG
jgi:hypothetical protein